MEARRGPPILVLAWGALAAAGCAEDVAGPVGEFSVQGEHVLVVARPDRASMAEVEAVAARGEALFLAISAYVGPLRTPDEPIRITLTGDQTDRGSYLNFDGVHLARYSAEAGGYLAVLAHELVHAFGASWFIEHQAWDWATYRYFDEGFAEYMAQRVDPGKRGFPFFGYPEDAVAGHWLAGGEGIAHELLRTRHDDLNDRCDLQAYTLRASWMRHLEEVVGQAGLLAVVYPEEEPTSAVVESLVGRDLQSLDAAWEAWLRARYEARSDTAAVREGYRGRTPWYTPCLDGAGGAGHR